MRKTKLKAAVFTWIFSLLVVLTGCGEKEKFVGTWKAEVDMAEQFNEGIAQEEEVAKYVNIKSFPIVFLFTFNQDDTYEMEIDKDSLDKSIEGVKADFKVGMTDYMAELLETESLGISVDEALALSGMTLDEVVDDSFQELDIKGLVEDFAMEGNYEAVKGKLYLSDGKDRKVDKSVYETYEFEGADIKLIENTSGEIDEETQNILQIIYPLVLKKIK